MPSFQIYSNDSSLKLFPLLWYLLHVRRHWSSRHLNLSSICPRITFTLCVCFHVTFLSRSLTLGDHSLWSNCNSLHSSSLPWSFLSAFIWPDLQSHPQPKTNIRFESLQTQLYHLFAMFLFWTLQLQAVFWGPLQPLCTTKNLPSSPQQWLILCPICQQPCFDSSLGWVLQSRGRSCDVIEWKKTHQNKTWASCKPHHLLTVPVFKIPEEPLFPYL